MPFRTQLFNGQPSVVYRRLRFLCVLVVVFSVVAPIPVTQAASAAVGEIIRTVTQSLSRHTSVPQNVATPQTPDRAPATRISIIVYQTQDVALPAEMTSVLIVSPEIASAELNVRTLRLTGLHVGETILIAFDGQKRYTFLVQVIGRNHATAQENTSPPAAAVVEQGGLSGLYTVSYSAPFGSAPAVLRQRFDWQRKLTQGRTIRFSSDMFKFMGQGNQDGVRATAPGLGLDRMSLGMDGPAGSVDLLDSMINISPLSFNNYTMRGFHIVSTPNSQLRGMEFFAGIARPSLSFFDQNEGSLVGLILPVAHGRFWQVRVGLFTVSPAQNNKLSSGGSVGQITARYAPGKNLAVEGELGYANGGFSWRARLDLTRGPITAFGEILRFDGHSPLVSIGAQAGGRDKEALSVKWRANSRLNASFTYNHTAISPPATARIAALDRASLLASINYRINSNQRIGFRYSQQQIETGLPSGGPRFRLETRTASINYDIRFNKSLSNSFQARLNSSRETSANAAIESGLGFNEQLRLSFKGGSATGFVNYTRQTPSLAGLIVRNPQLLPPLLQRAYAADPAHFLETNRDSLNVLLPGVELPQTRGLDAGVRLQKAFSRVNLASEVRYSTSQILAQDQRNVLASVSMNLRLDAANSVEVSGSRSFAFNHPGGQSGQSGGQSALTVSYVHRFGAGSGGGFQFSRMLGLERGQIQGRVYFDLNGNGQADSNEPGMPGMRVQIDGDRGATTNDHGDFHFQMNPGEYNVAMISDKLGVQLMASTATEQHVSLFARQTVNLNFGLSNFGLVAGRVFNDVSLSGEKTAGSLPGVGGVRISLRPTNAAGETHSMTVDASGAYQFRNIAPGSYTLEIDPATLPADFRMPAQTSWGITVGPLQHFYLDLSLSAQRAVYGVVFVDKDGDGKFDPEKDEPLEGALVIAGKIQAVTGKGGSYILRSLPSGRIEIRARAPWGGESRVIVIQFSEEPKRLKGINFAVTR